MSTSPYFRFTEYLQQRFGEKVWKIPVHAPFTCPNRDGTVGTGGCIYCRNEAFSPTLEAAKLSIKTQIQQGMKRIQRKRKVRKFLVYFQSYTNTYDSVDRLKKYYDQAVAFDAVVGLAIGTRPDCVSREILGLIESYSDRAEVWLEYGLQTKHNRTLKFINRGHTYEDFLQAIELTAGRRIKICVHVILGLPGESHAEILETADALAQLPIHGVKLHPLQVHTETLLEKRYHAGKIDLMDQEEYVRVCCDYLERLPEKVVIQRLTADAPREILVAPDWCANKMAVLNAILAEFQRRRSRQGMAVQGRG